jgi:ribonuclease PH
MLRAMNRPDGRAADQLRPLTITPNYLDAPAGSVLIEMGRTRVVCAVSVEDGVPRWMREQGVSGGWITAEYSLLPFASSPRKPREVARGRPEGRTHEIQRLIGRALRAVTDLEQLGARTLWVDCDVLQADGGTRAAAVTGASVALALALQRLQALGMLPASPQRHQVAAVSVGLCEGLPLLDLCYTEDAGASVDANVVMTGAGELVEVQASGEESPFAKSDLTRLLEMAEAGIRQLLTAQRQALLSA